MRVFDPRQAATPRRRVLVAVAPQSIFQGLVGAFCLAVRLRMIPRGEADRGPNPLAKSLPHLGCELGTPVRNDVHWNPVETDNVTGEQITHLCSGRKLGQRNIVHRLGEAIHYGQDGVVTVGAGKSGYKIHGDV